MEKLNFISVSSLHVKKITNSTNTSQQDSWTVQIKHQDQPEHSPKQFCIIPKHETL